MPFDRPRSSQGCGSLLGLLLLTWCLGWFSAPVGALAISKGFEWFIADTYGIAPLSFVQAWGVNILVHLLTIVVTTSRDDEAASVPAVVGTVFSSAFVSAWALVSMLVLVQFR